MSWNIKYRADLPHPGYGSGSSFLAPYETTADVYVSSTGSNSNSGTRGSPYLTIPYALGQIGDGLTVGVLDNLTYATAFGSLDGGISSAYKRVVGIDGVRVLTGTVSGTASNLYLVFKGLKFLNTGNVSDTSGITYAKFIGCGWEGGPAGGGSGDVTHLAGDYQLHEGCWYITTGGRYGSLCYERTNSLYRRCVVRLDNWGSPADNGNPNAGIQIYSAVGPCGRIQCIGVDGIPQRSNNETLGAFSVTSNTGAVTGAFDIECIAVDNQYHGLQVEGANNITWTGTNLVSVRNDYGFIENLKNGNTGPLTISGGEFSGNTNDGLAGFGSGNVTASNVNTTGNGGSNFNGVTSGSGNTTSALDMNARLSAMKMIGVSGTLYGESGWNTTQAEDLFPFPYEEAIRADYATKSTRGFCGGSYTLSSYLKRAA